MLEWTLYHVARYIACHDAFPLASGFQVVLWSLNHPILGPSQQLSVSWGWVFVMMVAVVLNVVMCFGIMLWFVFHHLFCFVHWLRQLLAGMVAEPAFLSEYTIFALDSSKQPHTQTGSVVSPCTAFCIPLWESPCLGGCSTKSHVADHLLSLRVASGLCC